MSQWKRTEEYLNEVKAEGTIGRFGDIRFIIFGYKLRKTRKGLKYRRMRRYVSNDL